VNFWASWCLSCAAEMPAFERVHQRLDGKVTFLGINQRDSREAAEELVRSTGVTYRLAEDPRGRLFAEFGGTGMPTTVLIDGDGAVADLIVGPLSEQQLLSVIEKRLGVEV
jgi:thiol-disulfide isomerase/thioredoxin